MTVVEVLGPLRVAGARLTSPTQRTLLAVLAAAAPDAIPVHRLVDAVWDDPPPSAMNSLHSHLTRLRKVVGADSIVREGDAYRLHASTDAAAFLALVDDRQSTAIDRRRQLHDALSLWRGAAFGEYGEHRFVRPAVAALTARYCGAVRELAAIEIADGDPLAAVSRLRKLVADQPSDEEAWVMLVEALHAGGRRTEALRAVREASQCLADVGLDVTSRLRDAEATVLHADRSQFAPPIPRAAGPLVGRSEFIERVESSFAQPGWTTLLGPGGVGKTRLAIELASRGDLPVVFADLTEAARADVDATIARFAGVPIRPPYIDRVAAHLAPAPALLVLDCCEAATDAVARIGGELVRRCPELRVLATSRAPIGVRGERLIEIDPLSEADAAALLRMRADDAGTALPDDATIEALCRAVDCLPLNLEILVGSLRLVAAERLLATLDEPLDVLGGVAGDLTTSVMRSVSLLTERERATFEALSLFRSPFVLEVATASLATNTDRPIEELRALRDHSLISSVDTRSGRRLLLLDTVRSVARAELQRRPDRLEVERRFVDALQHRADEIDRGLRTADEVAWLDVAEAEIIDLRAAHDLALAHGAVDPAMAIPASLFPLAYDRLRSDLGAWADASIDRFGDEHPLAPAVLAVAALGAMHTDDHDGAWARVERGRRCASGVSRHIELVAANLDLRSGDLAATEAAAKRVVAAADAAEDPYVEAIGHLLHALALGYRGDPEGGLEVARPTRTISRQVGAPTLLAYADYVEGELRSEIEPTVALELLWRAYERALASRSSLAEGVSLLTVTAVRSRSVDQSEAGADFAAAITHWRDRGDWNLQWSTLRNVAEFLVRQGSDREAAVIIGAVDAHGPTAYGLESERFERARSQVVQRIGDDEFARLEAIGRSLTPDELLDNALAAARG